MQWGKEANEETAGNLSGFALLSMHNDEKMSSQWVSPWFGSNVSHDKNSEEATKAHIIVIIRGTLTLQDMSWSTLAWQVGVRLCLRLLTDLGWSCWRSIFGLKILIRRPRCCRSLPWWSHARHTARWKKVQTQCVVVLKAQTDLDLALLFSSRLMIQEKSRWTDFMQRLQEKMHSPFYLWNWNRFPAKISHPPSPFHGMICWEQTELCKFIVSK